jgi:hypothetical protein
MIRYKKITSRLCGTEKNAWKFSKKSKDTILMVLNSKNNNLTFGDNFYSLKGKMESFKTSVIVSKGLWWPRHKIMIYGIRPSIISNTKPTNTPKY